MIVRCAFKGERIRSEQSEFESMNKSLVTAGIPGGKYDLDVDAYES
jgi:hypothetical protein